MGISKYIKQLVSQRDEELQEQDALKDHYLDLLKDHINERYPPKLRPVTLEEINHIRYVGGYSEITTETPLEHLDLPNAETIRRYRITQRSTLSDIERVNYLSDEIDRIEQQMVKDKDSRDEFNREINYYWGGFDEPPKKSSQPKDVSLITINLNKAQIPKVPDQAKTILKNVAVATTAGLSLGLLLLGNLKSTTKKNNKQ